MKYSFAPAIVALLILSTSCSWYKDLERSLVDDDAKQQKKSRTVSRDQYDQLLVKYEELAKKYETLKEDPNAGKSSLVDELQNAQGGNFPTPAAGASTDTVSVAPMISNVTPTDKVPSDIDSQLELFRRGLSLKGSNPGEATKIFQQLENHGVPSVKVRAKFQVGELLYTKGHYDLALQVFEDIIGKHAESGVVLDALKYAVICSEKLGITNKKEQYASMLNDVFESKL